MLDDLYREIILDHYARPRNRGRLDPADIAVEGVNPSCGDEISVTARLRDGAIEEVRFDGKGCSISQASASMMSQMVKGKTLDEAKALVDSFKAMMRGQSFDEAELGDLVALQGVRKFPVRIKCATLAWVALQQGATEYEAGHRQVVTATSTEDDL
jgi:nitrogen fixation NifU-like protein